MSQNTQEVNGRPEETQPGSTARAVSRLLMVTLASGLCLLGSHQAALDTAQSAASDTPWTVSNPSQIPVLVNVTSDLSLDPHAGQDPLPAVIGEITVQKNDPLAIGVVVTGPSTMSSVTVTHPTGVRFATLSGYQRHEPQCYEGTTASIDQTPVKSAVLSDERFECQLDPINAAEGGVAPERTVTTLFLVDPIEHPAISSDTYSQMLNAGVRSNFVIPDHETWPDGPTTLRIAAPENCDDCALLDTAPSGELEHDRRVVIQQREGGLNYRYFGWRWTTSAVPEYYGDIGFALAGALFTFLIGDIYTRWKRGSRWTLIINVAPIAYLAVALVLVVAGSNSPNVLRTAYHALLSFTITLGLLAVAARGLAGSKPPSKWWART